MNYEPETEASLWRGKDLTPPGRVEKLSRAELQRWREVLTTALRRHEYLLSESGKAMIELSHQQSIARMTASLLDFRDWIGNDAQASLARLRKQMKHLEVVEQTRIAAKERATAKEASPSKLSKAEDIIGDDEDIRRAILAKHGSIEAFAMSL